MFVVVTAASHAGSVRTGNEDAMVVGPWLWVQDSTEPTQTVVRVSSPTVCAVVDGLGGHAGGEIASAHVAHGLAGAGPGLDDEAAVARALRQLHGELFDRMAGSPELGGMGSTVAGLVVTPERVLWFNVGDSRVFQYDHGYLGQVSVDDSPARPPGEAGPTSIVTATLGGSLAATALDPHVGAQPAEPPARFLLCTDGLTDVVDLDGIEAALDGGDDTRAVARLIGMAFDAGAPDNVSVAVVRLVGEEGDTHVRNG